MKKTNGITLITLIVTIILMLILASITVTVAINGGLFEYAGNAKDSAEIANEKDIVAQAFTWAESNSKTGRVTVDELQKNIPTDADVTVMDNGDTLVVKFNKNDRYYEIENSGKVEGPKEFIKDDYAGDLSKGGAYDGSASKPFKITCIEDLVAFSIMTNGGNKNLGLASNKFTEQYIELTKTLDFKSIFSYKDYTTTIYGDLNKDGKIEDIRTELTRTDEKCIGFKSIGDFRGHFEGNKNEIKNIYINSIGTSSNNNAGLFYSITNATIMNLGVTGNIKSERYAGGIVFGASGSRIENCNSKINIVAQDTNWQAQGTGGICGYINNGTIISNCYNEGKIEGNSCVGGIVGNLVNSSVINNCYNVGEIMSHGTFSTYASAGGIVGMAPSSDTKIVIKNCYNKGIVTLETGKGTGGIVGYTFDYNSEIDKNLKIINCYNSGLIEGKMTDAGGIIGYIDTNTASIIYIYIINCYNDNQIKSSKSNGGIIGSLAYRRTENCGLILHNVLNLGIVEPDESYEGEFVGYYHDKTKAGSFDNCFYYNKNTNNAFGYIYGSTVTGELTATEIDDDLITSLNEYVTNDNITNKDNEDFIELKSWQLKDGKVSFK